MAASADGRPQDVVCCWQGILSVTFLSPHCHSLIPGTQLTDETPLRQSRRPTPPTKISGLLGEMLQ